MRNGGLEGGPYGDPLSALSTSMISRARRAIMEQMPPFLLQLIIIIKYQERLYNLSKVINQLINV